jgi:hypothetical protein
VPPVLLKGPGRAVLGGGTDRVREGSEGVSGVTGVPNWMGYRSAAFLHRKAVRSRSCPRSPRSQRPGPFPLSPSIFLGATRRASQAGVLALPLPFLAPRRRRCGRPRTPSHWLGTPSVDGDRSARVVDARAVCRLSRGCSASFSHCCENHIQVSLSPTIFLPSEHNIRSVGGRDSHPSNPTSRCSVAG